MEDFIIYLLKNENDLFRANISEDLKQLIICLSTVSKLINNGNNKLKFLHDHLKSIIKRKINLIKENAVSIISMDDEKQLPNTRWWSFSVH
jgi:Mg2+ and Co2+ transporter CorA